MWVCQRGPPGISICACCLQRTWACSAERCKFTAHCPCSVLSPAGKWQNLGEAISPSRDFSVAEDAGTGTTYIAYAEIGPPGLRWGKEIDTRS